jgi:sigma-E factor negative regulatory protein RseC
MIEEHAVITELADGQATLEIERKTACGLCGQKRGCGNSTWGKLLGHKTQALRAENCISAHVGDSVVVGIDERAMLNSVLFLYGIPLVGLLLATILADMIFANELYVALSAALGLLLAFLFAKYLVNSRFATIKKSSNHYQAVILRRADDDACQKNK